jgi:hypothetical protein
MWARQVGAAAFGLAAMVSGQARAEAPEREYAIGEFSDELTATLKVADSNDVFRPGSVSVFERRSGKRILHVESEELTLDLDDGQVTPNVKEVPYGHQSVLIYEDFDLDGRKDLALMDGQNSCYHGPSFQIFLRRGARFVHSAAFTSLAQEYCGMFTVDAKAKRIYQMSKSGCCSHQFYTWDVVNREPLLREVIDETLAMSTPEYLERTTTRDIGTTTEYLRLGPEDDTRSKPILSFELAGPAHKRVALFATESGLLDYALVRGPDNLVELSYQLHVLKSELEAAPAHPFVWLAARAELSFQNGGYQYIIHAGETGLGVSVHHGGKTVFLPGVEATRRGSLHDLPAESLQNVTLAP